MQYSSRVTKYNEKDYLSEGKKKKSGICFIQEVIFEMEDFIYIRNTLKDF